MDQRAGIRVLALGCAARGPAGDGEAADTGILGAGGGGVAYCLHRGTHSASGCRRLLSVNHGVLQRVCPLGLGIGASLGRKLGRKDRKQGQKRRNAPGAKSAGGPKKPEATPKSKFLVTSRMRSWPISVRFTIWLVAALIVAAIPSYIIYKLDNPVQKNLPVGQSIMQQISNNFSFGFSQADISKAITLQSDDAMSIQWSRLSNGSIAANYRLGPYTVQRMTTKARIMAMVPASAKLVQCGYADLGIAASGQGAQFVPVVKTKCASWRTQTAKFYSTSLEPNQDPKGYYYIDLSFDWNNPPITPSSFGKDAIQLRYQGRFSTDPTKQFVPADRTKLHYDTAGSGNPSGLPLGVYLKYESGASETVTNPAPPPSTTSENTLIWVADKNQPTYDISILSEDTKTNQIFQFAGQGIFLIIGALMGAIVPRRNKDQTARS